ARFSLPDNIGDLCNQLDSLVNKALETKKIVVGDLHRTGECRDVSSELCAFQSAGIRFRGMCII
ncbi:MAG TPA: hypothetical protein PKI59_09820, partial [Candidatus Cloacimonadota bacterium]|nr:hypothetical protein [Candidatus Cloacimonadota bacterium]